MSGSASERSEASLPEKPTCNASGCLCPNCFTACLEGKGRERTGQLLPKAHHPTLACAPEQWERAQQNLDRATSISSSSLKTFSPFFLLHSQGVRIPSLGSFDIVCKWFKAKGETVIVQWPEFRLARNLVEKHNLVYDKEYLPGHREVEPLKCAEVAAAASVSWQTGEACIYGTTSLVSHCLTKGENIAFVLKDIGVLLIDGTRVQMKYYRDFLERICGKEDLKIALSKVPWLRDMVVSRVAVLASLTFSGRVIVFPKFQQEFVPKPPPRKPREASEVPPDQGKKGTFPELPPLPGCVRVTFLQDPGSRKKSGVTTKKSSQLPATPEGSSTRTQPGKKKEGKSTAKSKAKKMGPAKAVEPKSYTEEHRAVKVPTQGGVPEKAQANLQSHSGAPSPVQTPIASLWCRSSETSLLQEPNDNKSGQHPPGSTSQKLLKLRGEMSRPVLEKPHKTAWLTSHSESSLPEEHTSKTSGFVPLMHRRTKSLPCQPAQNGEGLLWRGMSSPH
ncbi:uncharacterized protein LOC121113457 [Gallus gallus]|uniref:uncharacterized protein LOC121113457 n=1 Tax=Gallus gallus TaxID=9031 RepID=UPI001AE306D3|nr:uncharacterized protein LOC121113457 [Gallus gallus]